jgi:hypothetical protein
VAVHGGGAPTKAPGCCTAQANLRPFADLNAAGTYPQDTEARLSGTPTVVELPSCAQSNQRTALEGWRRWRYISMRRIKDPTPEKFKEGKRVVSALVNSPESIVSTTDVQIVAGPWLSKDEAKITFVLFMEDHSPIVHSFARYIANGLFEWRRLTPFVEGSEAKMQATEL